jgi:hypothetical protein
MPSFLLYAPHFIMTSILNLSPEVLVMLAEKFEYPSDLNDLAQTCRPLHAIATHMLYKHFAPSLRLEHRSCISINGNIPALAKFLSYGIDLDYTLWGRYSVGSLAARQGRSNI